MLLGNDVLDVEGEEIGVVLMQAAVLTPTLSPFPNEFASGGIH